MLTDPDEIAIIAEARQANVRDPNRSRAHFDRIFDDFLAGVGFSDTTVLDLGPGQFDFGVLAADRGATVVAIDKDPAVVALGRHKGFDVVEGRIQTIGGLDWTGRFDGLFCKFSLNAFWFADDLDGLDRFLDDLNDTAKPDAWGWIAPWNGVPKRGDWSPERVTEVLARQADAFTRHGWKALALSDEQAIHYGVNGRVANHALFVRGIQPPATVGALDPTA